MDAFERRFFVKRMLKIAHRGAKGYTPENTLAAFQKALDMDADGIELDVHMSADGKIIVIHDETVNRTSNGIGFVTDFTVQQLKAFRIDGIHQIPELSEVFELVNRRCLINIELKSATATQPVCSLIEKYVSEKNWKYDSFLVSSFDWTALQKIKSLDPKIQLGVLAATNLELAIAFAKFIKAETIHPYFHLLNAENTKLMQEEGFEVFTWTVNEMEDIARMKSFNVDGIISDFPDRI